MPNQRSRRSIANNALHKGGTKLLHQMMTVGRMTILSEILISCDITKNRSLHKRIAQFSKKNVVKKIKSLYPVKKQNLLHRSYHLSQSFPPSKICARKMINQKVS